MAVILTLGYREEHNPSLDRLQYVLAHLTEFEGEEGFGICLTCADTEWSLGIDRSGVAIWLNLGHTSHGRGQPRQMREVAPERLLELWKLLEAGHLDEIEKQPWLQGHGK